MLVDIAKIKEQNYVRVEFPSKTKAKKFIKQLLDNGYSSAYPEELKDVVGDKVLLIYKDTLLATDKVVEHESQYYTEYVMVQKQNPIKDSLPTRKSLVHYFNSNILDSNLVLRHYIEFVDRPEYVGKWFIKDQSTKQYLEITSEQAEFVRKTMTDGLTQRVLGFPIRSGFQRTYWDNVGNIAGITLNGKPQQLCCSYETNDDF